MARHEMHLDAEKFEKVHNGTKRIEVRINDPKRRAVQVFDIIDFFHADDSSRHVETRVVERLEYDSFVELFAANDPLVMGYEDRFEPHEHDMHTYYSADDEERWGVVAFVVERVMG